MKKHKRNREKDSNLAQNSAATPDFVELPDEILENCVGGAKLVFTYNADKNLYFLTEGDAGLATC